MIAIGCAVINHYMDKNRYESDNHICEHSCWNDGYDYGEYLGWKVCNCYNEGYFENDSLDAKQEREE